MAQMINREPLDSSKNTGFAIHKIIAFVLFLSAVFLRTLFLGYSTLWHGEAENAEVTAYVLPYLTHLSYPEAMWHLLHMFPVNVNPFQHFLYPFSFSFVWFFGLNEWTIRLTAALGGSLSSVITYFLVKRHADRVTALFAMAMVAFNPYLIAFNRFGWNDSMQVALTLLGLLLVDKYCHKRSVIFLVLSAICFSWSFMVKFNAIVFIPTILGLYYYFYKLRLREIVLIVLISIGLIFVLFVDQTDELFASIMRARGYVGANIESTTMLSHRINKLLLDVFFYIKAYLKYFEFTLFPIIVCLVFWKKIENKFFKFLILFSVIYFATLFIQGRTFFRYLQIGILFTMIAFAFPMRKYATKRSYYLGYIFLLLFVLWSLFVHRSYIDTQYRHIPYKYINVRANELCGSGRILIYGRNSESEYYLSPTHNLMYDESKSPYNGSETRIDDFPAWADTVRKIPPTRATLLDSDIVHSGDIVIVTGMQMLGGEPSPRWFGYNGKGFRVYCHSLELPNNFYNNYINDHELQKLFEIKEKVFLSNGSDKLAGLILRKN